MKPIQSTFLLLLMIISIAGKSQTRNDIIGIWTVTGIIIPAEAEKKFPGATKRVESLLLHSIINVQENGNIKWGKKDKDLFKTSPWTFNEKTKTVTVGNPNGLKLMVFSVKKENEQWYFTPEDKDGVPVTFEVQKKVTP